MSKPATLSDGGAGPRRASSRSTPLVLRVSLVNGPASDKRRKTGGSRTLHVRGDDTLSELHRAILDAFGHEGEEHLYLFCLGESWQTLEGPCYSEIENHRLPHAGETETWIGDAARTTLGQLGLRANQKLTYWFDFGADWIHSVEVLKGGTSKPG